MTDVDDRFRAIFQLCAKRRAYLQTKYVNKINKLYKKEDKWWIKINILRENNNGKQE